MAIAFGQVGRFIGIRLHVIQFEFGALHISADRHLAVGRVVALGQLCLPAARRPKVTGEGIRQRVGDVPNQFELRIPNDAHRVIHLDFMKRVRRHDRFVVRVLRTGQNVHP